MMKRWKLTLLILAVLMAPGKSFALLGLVSVEGAVGGFMAAPAGGLQYDGSGNTNADVDSFLGFDSEVMPTARLRVELPLVIPNVYLMTTPLKFDGEIKKNVTFGGHDFGVNDDATLSLNQQDIALFYGVPFLGMATLGRVGVDWGVNVRLLDVEAEFADPDSSTTKKESVSVPVPLIFLAAQLNLIGGFALEAELRALDVDYARVISAIGRVKYETLGPVFVAAGYRHEEVGVDKDDLKMDITFAGPYVEAGFSF